MRKIDSVLFLLLSVGLASQIPEPVLTPERVRLFKVFSTHVQDYVRLQKELAAPLPAMKQTAEVEKIAEHQHELGRQIAESRRGAKLGDIFTPEVAQEFRKLIAEVFRGPKSKMARKTISPDEPSAGAIGLQVNEIRSDDKPSVTMPPTLLGKLPQLPKDLAYRIVGHHFALKDTKAGLIVDFIPNAIP